MSFSSDIKEKLTETQRKKEKNTEAYSLGLIGFGAELRADSVRFNTENKFVAENIEHDLLEYFNIRSVCENVHGYRIVVSDDRDMLLLKISDVVDDGTAKSIEKYLPDDKARHAFVIGAFMTGGSVSDPNKSYHIEFDTRYKEFADILLDVLVSLGANARVTLRKGHYIVYAKEYESIALILNVMGATGAVMDLYEIQAEKEMRNDLNRVINFETANVNKITKASVRQRQAIEKIIDRGMFESLPENLQEMARIRLENPDMALKDLGQMLKPSLGKSGVNHRLDKLLQIADEL